MKSWLFALGLALCCVVQANEKKRFEDFDHSQMVGNWYTRVMVTNCPMLEEMLPHMKIAPVSFAVESPEKLKMTMQMAMPEGCKTKKVDLKKENGVFTTECGCSGKKTVEYIQRERESMFTSINVSGKEKGQCKVATLVAKNVADIQDLEAFGNFVNEVGLGEKKIYVLSKEGMCPRSS